MLALQTKTPKDLGVHRQFFTRNFIPIRFETMEP